MDGLDWITVAAFVPLTAALALAGLSGALDPGSAVAAAGLLGGLLGFAPWNRPVARLFLGDAGSLGIGIATGFLLLALAARGHAAAAILLPLYHAADATLTLARRAARGERSVGGAPHPLLPAGDGRPLRPVDRRPGLRPEPRAGGTRRRDARLAGSGRAGRRARRRRGARRPHAAALRGRRALRVRSRRGRPGRRPRDPPRAPARSRAGRARP